MKGNRIFGMLALLLAVLVLVTALIGSGLDTGSGSLSRKWKEAVEENKVISAHQKAAEKNAPANVKKAATAVKGAAEAAEGADKALSQMRDLQEKLLSGETSGDSVLDSLRAIAGSAETDGTQTEITLLADSMEQEMFASLAASACKAISSAEDKIKTADESIASVYETLGIEYASLQPEAWKAPEAVTPDEWIRVGEACVERAFVLGAAADAAAQAADACQVAADAQTAADSMSVQGRFLIFIEEKWTGFIFTALILAVIGVVLMFFLNGFKSRWQKVPVFSTLMAVLVMVAIQTYALGFGFENIGDWLLYWFNNAMNVLRANSSIGMIALAMTFVIISGGIDLAVGSTLAGISTVIMCLIDVSKNGPLTAVGITGMPAYLIACGAGIVLGLLLGALTGTIVTEGKVPPFIATLGMMQLVRSVAQYFTRSYTPEVPKAFQGLANTLIGGQMVLPMIYWLVLAVIMYIISKHTAFGRYVYAIGSNERTTMLSGINVKKVKMKVYILSGFVVGLASILQVSRLRGVDVSSAGNGYEMNAIAAVVVGGTSMSGGKGSILGTVLGVLIIGIMNNLLVLLSVNTFLSNAFTGAIVIAAVLMQKKEKIL